MKTIGDFEWNQIVSDTRDVINYFNRKNPNSPIQFEYDCDEPASLTLDAIRFNGCNGDGHETFYLTRERGRWGFCKTARKPYDAVVCCVLMLCDLYARGHVQMGSDGVWHDDWIDARELYHSVFREAPSMPVGIDPSY